VLEDDWENGPPTWLLCTGRLAFSQMNAGLPDVYTLPIDLSDPEHPRPGKAEPFVAERVRVEADPAFSPDGKFIAYASSQEGVEQVFVRPFPGPGGEWKVSLHATFLLNFFDEVRWRVPLD
jgi:Tol biopolymer transport system component